MKRLILVLFRQLTWASILDLWLFKGHLFLNFIHNPVLSPARSNLYRLYNFSQIP
ncbi:hypothetical protein PITC_096880 [Penicillium italicum]|uniref:Uncharacterized protein n=1 Tax=Penicillium italicum TaxID=40296 RepID=A0A0A2KR66_PENIT|nr:hypothetical protein PITC_096880 [Penicillium italicum]